MAGDAGRSYLLEDKGELAGVCDLNAGHAPLESVHTTTLRLRLCARIRGGTQHNEVHGGIEVHGGMATQ